MIIEYKNPLLDNYAVSLRRSKGIGFFIQIDLFIIDIGFNYGRRAKINTM